MKALVTAALAFGFSAFPVVAGSISVGKDITYPTEFETRTQVINGKVTTVTVPTRFETRRTGTRMEPEFVGVSRLVKKDLRGKDLVLLRFHYGRQAQVMTGQTLELEGVKYRALGWRGSTYCLMDLETRDILRFGPDKKDS